MPAPFISYRVLSDIKAVVIPLTVAHVAAGRVDITSLGTITPLTLTLDRVALVFGEDFQIINDSGSVFLEFINDMAADGDSPIEADEVITFLYAADPS